MKLFRHFLHSNKKKLSTKTLQSSQPFSNSCSDQTFHLINKHTKCTCHYFNFNENSFVNHPSHRLSRNLISSIEYSPDGQHIFSISDFCLWHDVRSTLLELVDRVVTINETNHAFLCQTTHSVGIQTSVDFNSRRNAKIQTNTIMLCPVQRLK
ncbi:unnamed protein product [Adineta ricciae]|uniref:Uncharacterized protein n=1 Tax=Adineta ricciae TaxID=249248 RepID=A0A815BU99_ADIRI|nr:unnamed protein product [Adineta ricciae]